MKIRVIDAVLTCILCFLTGMAVMLWYTQLTEKPQESPVVNVYVIASDKEEEVKIEPSKETEIIIEEPKIKKKWYSEEIRFGHGIMLDIKEGGCYTHS